ncbi:homocysteine S-methyltransferase family protein [Actinocrispum wychmicini]|uniref:S-methylmethionine-dependent homocysteine/selenocysteine methylase n=1 Tax=Actinocrispum wychmicini TaxID=1213861 RepID=A0A4R2JIA3_9PSEU|nr:homocysteine S-methyltransferase family protein [Actinocrispum wychmicini]TCO59633.1 S-methylmethionine-dependent homocysteine/selenocysteine methylase [Actinocrispum wychmicini]
MLLDGSVATELRSVGHAVDAPWWTNRALMAGRGRAVVRSIHQAHLDAGADVLTAATYRCSREELLGLGLAPGSGTAWMVHAAVGVARAAAGARPGVMVAGAVGPLGHQDRERLRAEHGWLVTELARCGVDVVHAESMSSVTEAAVVVDLATNAGLPAWVSLRCPETDESVVDAVCAVRECGADLVSVSCATVERIDAVLQAVRERYDGPLGARPDAADDLARACVRWRTDYCLELVGGCCGTTAGHLRAMVTAPATGS